MMSMDPKPHLFHSIPSIKRFYNYVKINLGSTNDKVVEYEDSS